MNQKPSPFSAFGLNISNTTNLKPFLSSPDTKQQQQQFQSTHSLNINQRKQTISHKMTAGACLNLITLRVISIFNMEPIMIEDSSDQVSQWIQQDIGVSNVLSDFNQMLDKGLLIITALITPYQDEPNLFIPALVNTWQSYSIQTSLIQATFQPMLKYLHKRNIKININKQMLIKFRVLVLGLGKGVICEGMRVVEMEDAEHLIGAVLSMLNILNGLSHGDGEHDRMEELIKSVHGELNTFKSIFTQESMTLASIVLMNQEEAEQELVSSSKKLSPVNSLLKNTQ